MIDCDRKIRDTNCPFDTCQFDFSNLTVVNDVALVRLQFILGHLNRNQMDRWEDCIERHPVI